MFIGTYGTILGIRYLTRGATNVININLNINGNNGGNRFNWALENGEEIVYNLINVIKEIVNLDLVMLFLFTILIYNLIMRKNIFSISVFFYFVLFYVKF